MAKRKKNNLLVSDALLISKRYHSFTHLKNSSANNDYLKSVVRCLLFERIAHENWCYSVPFEHVWAKNGRLLLEKSIRLRDEFLKDDPDAKYQARLFLRAYRKDFERLRRWNLIYGADLFVFQGGPNKFYKKGQLSRSQRFLEQDISEEMLERARNLARQYPHLSRTEFCRQVSVKDYAILYRAKELDDFFVRRYPRAYKEPLLKEELAKIPTPSVFANFFASVNTEEILNNGKTGTIHILEDKKKKK